MHLCTQDTFPLKVQSHEIFDLWFFHQTSFPRPLFHTLKGFGKYFVIRRDIQIQIRLSSVNDTAESKEFP
jgi:hypothetical protein